MLCFRWDCCSICASWCSSLDTKTKTLGQLILWPKKKQDENKKTAHSCLHVLCYWWGFIRQWRQGNFLEHTDMQQRSRKGLSIVMSITKHHLLKMGSRFLFLCLALFDDCRECCPLVCIAQKIAVYHQLQTGRLSTGEVTLVRNRAETPGSRS